MIKTEKEFIASNNMYNCSDTRFIGINICNLMDYIYETHAPGKQFWEMLYEWECQMVKEFCDRNNLYLYEKPKEHYSEYEGMMFAMENKFAGVVLSNLS